MNFIERVMRVMTHVNIGAALGLAAWLLWSGWQVVTGQITPGHRVAEVQGLMRMALAGDPQHMPLMPVQAGAQALPPCHTAAPTPAAAVLVQAEADL